ncbi:YibE/F family protein [Salipaludibacillus daqingensis]|uniref:YibE/F family protein n=1 Tax=Salipaludibacillus daqingensis TaxID=3041001 RepID=UPI0024767803|nr:YibE/F family protein [Salipaludibacillus daqingensis]
MKKTWVCFFLFFGLFFIVPSNVFGESDDIISVPETDVSSETVRGEIIEILEDTPQVQEIVVKVKQGEFQGETVTARQTLSGNPAQDFYFQEGERVLIWIESEDGVIQRTLVRELTRDHYLGYLTAFFIFSLVLIGGIKGIKTVVSLALTAFLVIQVLIPFILAGLPPIPVTIFVASIIATSSVLIISGFNRKSLAAIIGTIGGVIIAGILAWVMTRLTRLTGLSGDETQMLMYIPQQIDFDYQGLLFAGMIIGAVGAVLDIGMSISSAVDEVKRSNPAISTKNLIKSGLNLGKDIMGTMANTLILAYTGASMSLLLVLVAHNISFARVVNMDAMSTEIVRILAGSIGLIYAIPITAIVAGLLYKNVDVLEEEKKKEKKKQEKRDKKEQQGKKTRPNKEKNSKK